MKNIIFIISSGFIISVAFILFLQLREKYRECKKLKKEIEEARKHEKKATEIISETIKTKADAISGDIDNDLVYMAGKLHEYAAK